MLRKFLNLFRRMDDETFVKSALEIQMADNERCIKKLKHDTEFYRKYFAENEMKLQERLKIRVILQKQIESVK